MSADLPKLYDTVRRIEPFAGLTTGGSRLYAVLGGPSSGKTLLLQHLENNLKLEKNPMVVPVYIDFNQTQVTSLNSTDKVLEWLLEQLRLCLKKEPYKLCALLDKLFERFSQGTYNPIESFSGAFNHMRDVAKRHLGDGNEVQLVALVDNADTLASLEFSRELFNNLHALLQNTQINGFLNLVFTGSDGLYDCLNESDSVWKNDAELLVLASFEPAETYAFLQEKTDSKLPLHICLLVNAYSGGHPFLLQHFLDELSEMSAGKWDAITADMVLGVAEDFPDHDDQGRIDIWRIPDQDESQMSHAAYRLLIESCPNPEILATTLSNPLPQDKLDWLTKLYPSFDAASETNPVDSLTNLAHLINTTLNEMNISHSADSDWSAQVEILHSEVRGLYNLLAFPLTKMRRANFRKELGQTSSQGYSYKRALDRLIYTGAIQFTQYKTYMIQGQIFLDQFQEFSQQGKYSLISSLQKRIQTLTNNLNTLKEQKAEFGDVDVPLHIINNIDTTQNELDEAHRELAKLKTE